MADGEKSHSKSPGLSSRFQRMYKAVSPSNPPWKEAYRKVLSHIGYNLQWNASPYVTIMLSCSAMRCSVAALLSIYRYYVSPKFVECEWCV